MLIYHDRYVDDTCMSADIVYSRSLMLDTIKYLESGCKQTSISNTSVVQIPNNPLVNYNRTTNVPFHKFILDSPYSSLNYKNYLKSLLHGHSIFSGNKTAGGLGPGNCITHICANQPSMQNNFNAAWSAKPK